MSAQLPLSKVLTSVSPEPLPSQELGSSGNRVLLVDDDILIRMACERALVRRGFGVVTVEDAASAWAKLSQTKFDLVITDHHMPEETGLSLIHRMRQAAIAVPTLLMSGNMPREALEVFHDLKPCKLLSKPFDVEELHSMVQKMLDA